MNFLTNILQPSMFFFLTIRKRVEDACGAEAAVAGRGVHPDLDLVRRGPAEVRQNRLVSVALRVVALVLTAALLWDNHRLLSSTQPHLERMRQRNKGIFHGRENVLQVFSTKQKTLGQMTGRQSNSVCV